MEIAEEAPLPESATACGLLLASSVIVRVAVRPACGRWGEKDTDCTFAARGNGLLAGIRLCEVAAAEIPLMFSATTWLLVMVSTVAALFTPIC